MLVSGVVVSILLSASAKDEVSGDEYDMPLFSAVSFPATEETIAIITTIIRASPSPSIYLYLSKKAFIFSP